MSDLIVIIIVLVVSLVLLIGGLVSLIASSVGPGIAYIIIGCLLFKSTLR